MSSRRFSRSLRAAHHGIRYAYQHERNFRLQLVAALVAIAATLGFGLSRGESVVIVLLIMLVLILELLNTAIERFVDLIKPRMDLHAEVVKDILAAMVLIASFGSVVVGIVIFWPYLIELL